MSRERERLGIAVGTLGIGVVAVGYALWGVAGAALGAALALAVAAFMLGSSSLPTAVVLAAVLVGVLALSSALTGGSSKAKPARIADTTRADTTRAARHPDPPSAGVPQLERRLAASGATVAQLEAQNRMLRGELAGARARSKRLEHLLRSGRRR